MSETPREQAGDHPGDKRKSLRSPLLVLKVKVDAGRKAFFGYAKNISRSGMFIATTNPREPGSRFEVEIPLPSPIDRTVACTCEVVWQRQFRRKSHQEPGMGLRFCDLDDASAGEIDAWIHEQAEKEAASRKAPANEPA